MLATLTRAKAWVEKYTFALDISLEPEHTSDHGAIRTQSTVALY